SDSAKSMPPFICKQLIQHMVTSNPSPSYIKACSLVFEDDGNGARGNLAAVVKAILTNTEARAVPAVGPTSNYGHLKEPALYMNGLLRLFNYARGGGNAIGAGLAQYGTLQGQRIFYPPSVFNYFPPDFPLPGQAIGGTLVAPEFGIENSATLF